MPSKDIQKASRTKPHIAKEPRSLGALLTRKLFRFALSVIPMSLVQNVRLRGREVAGHGRIEGGYDVESTTAAKCCFKGLHFSFLFFFQFTPEN